MSTRSYVGYEKEDGSIDYVYVHFDGYPDGVGAQLVSSWTKREKVLELLSKGGISSIGDDLAETNFYAKDDVRNADGFPYSEDGSGNGEIETAESLDELKAEVKDDVFIEYFYVFGTDDVWQAFDGDARQLKL